MESPDSQAVLTLGAPQVRSAMTAKIQSVVDWEAAYVSLELIWGTWMLANASCRS